MLPRRADRTESSGSGEVRDDHHRNAGVFDGCETRAAQQGARVRAGPGVPTTIMSTECGSSLIRSSADGVPVHDEPLHRGRVHSDLAGRLTHHFLCGAICLKSPRAPRGPLRQRPSVLAVQWLPRVAAAQTEARPPGLARAVVIRPRCCRLRSRLEPFIVEVSCHAKSGRAGQTRRPPVPALRS